MSSHSGRPPAWSYWVVLPAFVLLWALVAWMLESPLLPTPLNVLDTLLRESASGELWHHLSATLARVIVAFVLAMLLGTAIGIIMGRSRTTNALFDPMLVLLLNLPALVTIILMYVWFGLEEMATVYEFTRWQRFREVWVPQLFPYLMAATRGGLALIWKIVLVVELLGRSDGIGFQLHMAFQVFDVAAILAYSLAFIAVVQLIELAILQPLQPLASAGGGPCLNCGLQAAASASRCWGKCLPP